MRSGGGDAGAAAIAPMGVESPGSKAVAPAPRYAVAYRGDCASARHNTRHAWAVICGLEDVILIYDMIPCAEEYARSLCLMLNAYDRRDCEVIA